MKQVPREFAEQPDIRGLLALQRTCVRGSVAAAAAELGWSHPTLDHHINKLEKLLGAKLLVRSPQGSQPTSVGRFVSGRAEEILALCHQVVVDVRAARHHSSEVLRCAMIPTLAISLVPEIQHLLAGNGGKSTGSGSEVPRLDLTVDEISPILADVEHGKLEFAMIVGDLQALSARGDRLTFELVCTEPVYLCVKRDHPVLDTFADELPPLGLLSDERWAVGTEQHDPLDQGLNRISIAAGFTPNIGVRANDLSVVKRMVEAGLVVALLPESVLDTDDNLHRWLLPEAMLRREILFVTRRTPASRALAVSGTQRTSAGREKLGKIFDEISVATNRAFAKSRQR